MFQCVSILIDEQEFEQGASLSGRTKCSSRYLGLRYITARGPDSTTEDSTAEDSAAEHSTAEHSTAELYLPTTLRRSLLQNADSTAEL